MKEIIWCDTKIEWLYHMDDFDSCRVNNVQNLNSARKKFWFWHYHLGHLSFKYTKHLFSQLFLNLNYSYLKCETCILARSHRLPFPLSSNKYDIPFILIHSNVWGDSSITNVSSIRWFVTFVDYCTHMTWLYSSKHKDEVFDIFYTFHVMIKN